MVTPLFFMYHPVQINDLFYLCKFSNKQDSSVRIIHMEMITSLENSKVKKWTALQKKKERDKTGLFLIEGEHLIEEALKADVVETILTDEDRSFNFDHVIQVTPQIMKKISTNVSQVHEIAICHKAETVPEKMDRVLLLDGVQDPGNLGTLLRTAVSFSFDVLYLSEDACDLYNDKCIRSTQGALFQLPVIRGDLVSIVHQLQRDHFKVIATTLDNAKTMSEISKSEHMAFILGNEGKGVSKQLQEMADERLRIEMHGFESLNVAVAGGIVMHQYRGK